MRTDIKKYSLNLEHSIELIGFLEKTNSIQV